MAEGHRNLEHEQKLNRLLGELGRTLGKRERVLEEMRLFLKG